MSYAVAAALQKAVFERLGADPALGALTGGAVHDALPPGPVPGLAVLLGAEDVRERGDGTARGARHDFTVSVVSGGAGFLAAKAAAAAVSDALVDAPLALERGRLVSLTFLRASARAERRGTGRRIDLRFRARTEDD